MNHARGLLGMFAVALLTCSAGAAVVVVGNVTYEDFQGTPGTAAGSTPTPSNGPGTTDPLDSTWDYGTITDPSNTDYLQTAAVTFTQEVGTLHSISRPLSALADGLLSRNNDDVGGSGRIVSSDNNPWRVRVSFPELRAVTEVNTYSWHGSSRTCQYYELYGSAEATAPDASGADDAALQAAGWVPIANVNSDLLDAELSGGGSQDENSKHGVSITGTLGEYEHLLFSLHPRYSGTWYSEWDVYTEAAQAGADIPEPATAALLGLGGIAILRRRRRS